MDAFEQFKEEQFKKDPQLRRSSDVFLRQMYAAQAETDVAVEEARRIDEVILTTANGLDGFRVSRTIDIVTAECVFGMNVLRDFFAAMTDFFGGRSEATQNVLRDARTTCLRELRREALLVGANAVIAVDLDYSEFSGQGKSMLFLVASGTAVVVERVQAVAP